MVQMTGKYVHEKSENLDEYFKALGVPYIPRKMMGASNPTFEISNNEQGEWQITIITLLRTQVLKFRLGEEYEEHMPGKVIKSTTTIEGENLFTKSIAPDGEETSRLYEFSDSGCVIKYRHEKSGKEALRYYKKVVH